MARVFIIHCWEGTPKDFWYASLARSLRRRGHSVRIPLMPDTEAPVIEAWLEKIKKIVGTVRSTDVFVGHSIGCQTIARFLMSQKKKCAAVLFVAPWVRLANLEPEGKPIARPWLNPQLNIKPLKAKADRVCVFLSSNDPYVAPAFHNKLFKRDLKADVRVLAQRGHFADAKKDKKLPEALVVLRSLGL